MAKVEEMLGRSKGGLVQSELTEFYKRMLRQKYLWPRDQDGKLVKLRTIPDKISELRDDPYRSLVWALIKERRNSEGSAPFAEFLWAQFLP